jgi:hypothetical protein
MEFYQRHTMARDKPFWDELLARLHDVMMDVLRRSQSAGSISGLIQSS